MSSVRVRMASCANSLRIGDSEAAGTFSPLYDYAAANGGSFLGSSWSPDGSCLASTVKDSQKIVMTYVKKNVFTSSELMTIANPLVVLFPARSISSLIVGSSDRVVLYDIRKKKPSKDFQLKTPLRCMSSNFNDSFVAVGGKNGSVYVLNTVTNYINNAMKPAGQSSHEISAIQYGHKSLLAAASEAGTVTLWDCNTASRLKTFSEHLAPCTGVTFSPVTEKLVLSIGLDKKCIFYDTQSAKQEYTMKTEFPLTAVQVFPDGRHMALGTSSGKVMVYDLRSLIQPLHVYNDHSSGVTSIVFQPATTDGNKISGQFKVKSKNAEVMKENVPAISPASFKETETEPPASEGTRDSFSNQIISPIRGSDTLGLAASPLLLQLNSSSGVSNQSHDSLFSPLREFSINSPANSEANGCGGRGSSGSIGFPRTPVASFNKSISTPLVSPLTIIREEDIFDNEVASKLSKDAFLASGDHLECPDPVAVESTVKEQSLVLQAHQDLNQLTVESASGSFKSNLVFASTPFASVIPALPKSVKELGKQDPTGKSEQETFSDIKAIMTAFPRVLLENHAAADERDGEDLNFGKNKRQKSTEENQLTSFQQEYLRNCVQEVVDEHCSDIRQHMWHMQYDMIRSFQNQKEEIEGLLKQYAVNDQLVKELERVKKENEELKKYF